MRAYLVKDEGTLQKLAEKKHKEDLQIKNNSAYQIRGEFSAIDNQSMSSTSFISKEMYGILKSEGKNNSHGDPSRANSFM